MIQLKRLYDRAENSDGRRFLVDRLWPRGLKKETLRVEAWLQEVAPSKALCKWFGHDPAKWPEFQRRYFAELDANSNALQPLLTAAQKGRVTLLFGARDTEHNNAIALKAYLGQRLKPQRAQAAA